MFENDRVVLNVFLRCKQDKTIVFQESENDPSLRPCIYLYIYFFCKKEFRDSKIKSMKFFYQMLREI